MSNGSAEIAAAVAETPEATLLDPRRSALVIAGPENDGQGLAAIVEAAGLRLLGLVPAHEAPERLGQVVAVDLLLVGAPADDEDMRALLPRLDQMARMGDAALIVVANPGSVDMVFTAVEAPTAHVLCDPEPADIAAAVALALSDGPMLIDVHDVGRETEAARLARLSEEVSRLARSLAAASYGQPASDGDGQVRDRMTSFSAAPGAAQAMEETPPVSAATLRSLLRMRRLRDQMFPEGLFADPAWDMLLDLTAARLEGEKVSVSSLCIAAAVPPTTALRWIRNLTEQGIFQRQADYQDGRRVFIALSDSAFAAINAYFRAAQRMGAVTA